MKQKIRSIVAGVMAALAVMMAGCGSEAVSQQPVPSATPAPSATPEPAPTPEPRETVDLADFGGMPKQGDCYGKISVAGTKVDCDLYYGDASAQLQKGAGTFMDAQLPGQGGRTLVAAHTGSYFRDLESAELGADVTVVTDYGEFHYTITDMQVVESAEFGMDDLLACEQDSLLLYTCYPFGQTTPTPQRYMIWCEYLSGPILADSSSAE